MTRLDSPDYIDEANVQSAVKMLAPITYHVRSPGTAGPGSNPYLVHRIKHPKSLAIPTPSTTVYPVLNLNIGQTKLLLCACEVFVFFVFILHRPGGPKGRKSFSENAPGGLLRLQIIAPQGARTRITTAAADMREALC